MIKLIADSGSTKADWSLLSKDGNPFHFMSMGLNPLQTDEQQFRAIIKKQVLPALSTQPPNHIYFYGAGCYQQRTSTLVQDILQSFFLQANVEVYTDLLGACRALSANQKSIVSILGTGASSCVFNGTTIQDTRLGLGYVLGDEGSGAVLGKNLLSRYLNNELPKDLMESFSKQYNIEKDSVLERVYQKNKPNRYLASFALYLHQNRQKPYVANLLVKNFQQFFEKYIFSIPNYSQYVFHFTGSIAYNFSEILRKLMDTYTLKTGKILQSPIEGLSVFHSRFYR